MIDLALLRLRYEILNASLASIASDEGLTPKSLENEAHDNNWKQWWPSIEDLQYAFSTSSDTPSDSDNDDDGFEELSPLEEGSTLYIKEAKLRLQVFNLAKDLHLAHKYAAFESALVTKAHSLVAHCVEPADIRQLTMSLKDLPGKVAAAGLAISQGDDGIPTVIIRDLSGR